MNKKDLAIKRNNTARLFRHSSKVHRNCIRLNSGNTIEHELKKFRLCWALKKAGEHFITEAVFESGLRADVVSLDKNLAYEIIASEKEESLTQKATNYPIPIIKVRINH